MEFRVARHTNSINELIDFYTGILGFTVLGRFEGHDGYDGVFLGIAGADWHLEFTTTQEPVVHHFDEDDLLVFYPRSVSHYETLLDNFRKQQIEEIRPKNPYWQKNGKLFADPDGFGVLISDLKAVATD